MRLYKAFLPFSGINRVSIESRPLKSVCDALEIVYCDILIVGKHSGRSMPHQLQFVLVRARYALHKSGKGVPTGVGGVGMLSRLLETENLHTIVEEFAVFPHTHFIICERKDIIALR